MSEIRPLDQVIIIRLDRVWRWSLGRKTWFSSLCSYLFKNTAAEVTHRTDNNCTQKSGLFLCPPPLKEGGGGQEWRHKFRLNLCQLCFEVPKFVPLSSLVIHEPSLGGSKNTGLSGLSYASKNDSTNFYSICANCASKSRNLCPFPSLVIQETSFGGRGGWTTFQSWEDRSESYHLLHRNPSIRLIMRYTVWYCRILLTETIIGITKNPIWYDMHNL